MNMINSPQQTCFAKGMHNTYTFFILSSTHFQWAQVQNRKNMSLLEVSDKTQSDGQTNGELAVLTFARL